MSENAGAGPGNQPGGGGTAQPSNGVDERALKDLVYKAVRKQFKDANLGDLVKAAVSEALPKLIETEKRPPEQQQAQPPPPAAPSNSAQETQEKLTMKALQDQIQKGNRALADLENRLKEADQRAKDARVRGEVEKRFLAKLGADNPAVSLLMDSFYDVRKRVVEQDGNVYVKFKGEYGGDDDLKSLDDGITALFDKGGEYAHLVPTPNKAGALPPRSPLGARGQPAPNAPRNQNGAPPPPNGPISPIYAAVQRHFDGHGEGDVAAALGLLAAEASASPNGTSE